MATFSIGDDEEDHFAPLRKANPPMTLPSGKAGKVTKLGAVPLKTAEPAKGGSLKGLHINNLEAFSLYQKYE